MCKLTIWLGHKLQELYKLWCIGVTVSQFKASQLFVKVAFDTVDHATLPSRLELVYNIHSSVLSCVRSYLSDQSQFVHSGSTCSVITSSIAFQRVMEFCLRTHFVPAVPPTLSGSSPVMGCTLTCTLMIVKFLTFVYLQFCHPDIHHLWSGRVDR